MIPRRRPFASWPLVGGSPPVGQRVETSAKPRNGSFLQGLGKLVSCRSIPCFRPNVIEYTKRSVAKTPLACLAWAQRKHKRQPPLTLVGFATGRPNACVGRRCCGWSKRSRRRGAGLRRRCGGPGRLGASTRSLNSQERVGQEAARYRQHHAIRGAPELPSWRCPGGRLPLPLRLCCCLHSTPSLHRVSPVHLPR